jgi:hypothetical protein
MVSLLAPLLRFDLVSKVASAWWRSWGDRDQHRLATALRLRHPRVRARVEENAWFEGARV